MNNASEKRLAAVHPELAARIRRIVDKLAGAGIWLEVVQGLRTYAEQDALYAQGRTKPGKRVTNARGGESNHNFGLAVDVCPFLKDRPIWDAPQSTWLAIGEAGKAEGLEWGGSWKSPDRPHLQIRGPQLAECRSLFKAGGLERVWAKVRKG